MLKVRFWSDCTKDAQTRSLLRIFPNDTLLTSNSFIQISHVFLYLYPVKRNQNIRDNW